MAKEWLNSTFSVVDPAHPNLHPSLIQQFYFMTPKDWTELFGDGYPFPPFRKLRTFYVHTDGRDVAMTGWLVAKMLPLAPLVTNYKQLKNKMTILSTVFEEIADPITHAL